MLVLLLLTLSTSPLVRASDYPERELIEACKVDVPKHVQPKLSEAQVQAACGCLFRNLPDPEKKKFSGDEWLEVAKGMKEGRSAPKKPLANMTKEERERHKAVAMFTGFYLMGLDKPEVKKCTEASPK